MYHEDEGDSSGTKKYSIISLTNDKKTNDK